MDISTVLWSLAVALLIVGLGILLIYAFRQFQIRHPSVLLKALEPLMWQGIAAALLIAKNNVKLIDGVISGWDMGAMANATYDLMPDFHILGLTVKAEFIKSIVTKEMYVNFLKTRYDAFRAWELPNEQYLMNQLDQFKNPPSIAPGLNPPVELPPKKDTTIADVLINPDEAG